MTERETLGGSRSALLMKEADRVAPRGQPPPQQVPPRCNHKSMMFARQQHVQIHRPAHHRNLALHEKGKTGNPGLRLSRLGRLPTVLRPCQTPVLHVPGARRLSRTSGIP